MGKQYISAAVASTTAVYSIDSSSAVTDLAFGQQTPTAEMPKGSNTAALFQAINALLSSNTRYTTINFYHQYYRGILGSDWLEQRELTINIVWSQAGVPGEISYGGFGVGGLSNHPSSGRQGSVAGNMSFSGLSGNTNIDLFRIFPYTSMAYSPGKAFEINLDLTPGSPKINSLPFYGGGYSVSYTIETDDGVIVSAAAAPGDPTGIKISELTPTTSLNTTDLFVLSRDDPAGAPYDKSLNITKTDLIASVYQEIAPGIPAPVFLGAMKKQLVSAPFINPAAQYDLTSSTYGNIPVGAKFAILECYWSLSGYDGVGPEYIYMGPGPVTNPRPYILAAMRSAGDGDAVAGANQAMCPIENGIISLYSQGGIQGNFVVNIVGYYT